MITLDKIRHEIHDLLENGCMSKSCVQDLTMLYWLKEQMERDEMHAPRQMEWHHKKLDRKEAEQWVMNMENADGTKGGHWTYDQTQLLMKQRNIDCDPVEFYAAMNMLWSDYKKVVEKYGISGAEFWAELTKAFLTDKDAVENKLAIYHACIVKK